VASSSSIGFGHNPFGNHQFGFGDWAEEMLWQNMPEVYRDCDEVGPTGSAVQQPLRKFQSALKASYQDIRIKWHQFPNLWDAISVPLDQLPQLGYNVGITVDPTKSEGLQRSSVLNASQLWINKGTDKGYELTAAFEGLLVTITPLWAKTCGPSSHELGTIGTVPASFDLSTTPLTPRPVGPGTLHVVVTNSYGTEEDITDDEVGNLVGAGNQLNGPLTRLNLAPATTLTLTSIAGLFRVGDGVSQGAATGIIIASSVPTITIETTAGAFAVGPGLVNTTTFGTADISALTTDVLEAGETITGQTSGTTAAMRDFRTTYSIVDRISTLAGFTPGEYLQGVTSGNWSVASAAFPLVPGPLRARLDLSGASPSSVGDEITGTVSGAVGIVTAVSGPTLYVELITEPGFEVGETLTAGPQTIDAISYGTVDYISGEMTGFTVPLQAGSSINSVVDLQTTGATQFVPAYDEESADMIAMDSVQSDRYALWPITTYPVRIINGILTQGECRSYSLRLYFYTPDDTEIENFVDVARRIALALEQFRPLHVRFDKISFDGARASSQVWRTGQVIADSSAASVWTAPVAGTQLASSQVWTTGPFSATVAT
jgi:hypothetical protein